MSLIVDLDLGYEFAVKARFKDVFDVLSDVPTSAGFFPKVDALVKLGKGVYRWEMAPVPIGQNPLQTVYASQYVCSRKKGTVVWTPVPGQGNAMVGGSWQISDQKESTALVLQIQGSVELPLPGLMKVVVAPLVTVEFEQLVESYIDNLIEHFGGEV
jgi:carbon monoxide dehydrogenase subunit G